MHPRQQIHHIRKSILAFSLLLLASSPFGAQASEIILVHPDHQGNPIAYTDINGNVIGREYYTPDGETLNPPTTDDSISYTGHVKDSATGFLYMQARYYDPVVGRFLSVDPVTFSPDKLQHFNRYWYANGNPLIIIDPTGKSGDWFGDNLDLGDFLSEVTGDSAYSNMSDTSAAFAMDAEASGVVDGIEFSEALSAGEISLDATIAGSVPGHAAVGILSYSGGDITATLGGGACPTCLSPVQATADISVNISLGPEPADGPVILTTLSWGGNVGGTATTTFSTSGVNQSAGAFVGSNTGVTMYSVTGYRKTIYEGGK